MNKWIGRQFGRLTVLSPATPRKRNRRWNVRCSCGVTKIVQQSSLISGATVSCGCYGKEQRAKAATTHGKSHAPEYWVYWHMRQRCENPKDSEYHNYGQRGITICKRWSSDIEAFFTDMGMRPSPHHSLERINNEQGYSPENCKWATPEEQSNNKRGLFLVTHNGKTKTAAQWAREYGLPENVLRERLRRGWSFERAVTRPIRIYREHK